MDRDWKRLGAHLQAARKAKGITQAELADEFDSSRSLITQIEGGREFAKPTLAIRAFARRVGWTDESVDTVLAGGEPVLIHTDSTAPMPTVEAEGTVASAELTGGAHPLPLRIVSEIQDDGPLLDATVIPLGEDARMVVVVKGKPNASPDEIRQALDRWQRAQPRLAILGDANGNDDHPPVANEA